jgi:hypothetical protein
MCRVVLARSLAASISASLLQIGPASLLVDDTKTQTNSDNNGQGLLQNIRRRSRMQWRGHQEGL